MAVDVAFFRDFTGGLNLSASPQTLAENETFNCSDVDFGRRGGFMVRPGLQQVIGSTAAAGLYLLGQFNAGTEMVLGVRAAGTLLTWDGTTVAGSATVTDSSERVRMGVWGSNAYLANCRAGGVLSCRRWNGSTLTTLGAAFNDDYTAPTTGNMPPARVIAPYGAYMWVADTTEASVRFRSRLRFSHAFQPESWAAADYYDIEVGDQSDSIVALVPFRSVLLVFKRNSVWGVYGTSRDDFVVDRIASGSGAVSAESIAVAPDAVWWWSPDGTVYRYDGSAPVNVGERIAEVCRSGVVAPAGNHLLSWADNRLWVSLLSVGGSERLLFVFDPFVGEAGAWTRYGFQASSLIWLKKADGNNQALCTLVGKYGVYRVDNDSVQSDTVEGVVSGIDAFYQTGWFAAGDTNSRKRWRRLRLTAAAMDDCEMTVQVFHDFDESTLKRDLLLQITAASGSMMWDSGLWDSGVWAGDGLVYEFERLGQAGASRSIMFKFSVSGNSTRWWVDSFSLPFKRKAYR